MSWNWQNKIDGVSVGYTNIFIGQDMRRAQFVLSRGSVHELKAKNYTASEIIAWLYKAANQAEAMDIEVRKDNDIEMQSRFSIMQKNKSGFVYFMYCREKELMKIGCSGNPEKRRKAVEKDVGAPVELLGTIRTLMMYELENEFHNLFSCRHKHGEWFDLRPRHMRIVKRHLNKKIVREVA